MRSGECWQGGMGELQILQDFVEHRSNFGFTFECIGKPLEVFEPRSEKGVIY